MIPLLLATVILFIFLKNVLGVGAAIALSLIFLFLGNYLSNYLSSRQLVKSSLRIYFNERSYGNGEEKALEMVLRARGWQNDDGINSVISRGEELETEKERIWHTIYTIICSEKRLSNSLRERIYKVYNEEFDSLNRQAKG